MRRFILSRSSLFAALLVSTMASIIIFALAGIVTPNFVRADSSYIVVSNHECTWELASDYDVVVDCGEFTKRYEERNRLAAVLTRQPETISCSVLKSNVHGLTRHECDMPSM